MQSWILHHEPQQCHYAREQFPFNNLYNKQSDNCYCALGAILRTLLSTIPSTITINLEMKRRLDIGWRFFIYIPYPTQTYWAAGLWWPSFKHNGTTDSSIDHVTCTGAWRLSPWTSEAGWHISSILRLNINIHICCDITVIIWGTRNDISDDRCFPRKEIGQFAHHELGGYNIGALTNPAANMVLVQRPGDRFTKIRTSLIKDVLILKTSLIF